jgi:glucuronokinase
MIYTATAFARAALVGNPSDGYFGKTISFVVRNFKVTVRLWESPHFEIVPDRGDLTRFENVDAFLRDIQQHGYYGGTRLIKAAVKRFHEYCKQNNRELHNRNFTIDFDTDIPRLVGLSGASAIVVATLRALMKFYELEIPKPYLPTLTHSIERDELNIPVGMQDRVVQTYEGIVYMDFDRRLMESRAYGEYLELLPAKLPPLYIAYDPNREDISDVPHRNLRALFDAGDPDVLAAMQKYRELTDRGRDALMKGDWDELHKVMDANFDLRKTIMEVAPENQRMIDEARHVGASAKFAGGGGAIVGLYHGARQYQDLLDAMGELRCKVIRPMIFEN